jgi:hypothetical protein
MVAALYLAWSRLVANWDQVTAELAQVSVVVMLSVTGSTFLMLVLMPLGWMYALRASAAPIDFQLAFVMYYRVSILHYLPGSLWHLPGRAMLCQQRGIPLAAFTRSAFLEQFFLLSTGGMLAGGGVAIWLGQPAFLILTLILLGLISVIILMPAKFSQNMGLPLLGVADRKPLMAMVMTYWLVWLSYGVAIFQLLEALAPHQSPPVWAVIPINSAAYLTGYFSLAPTGVGVRELRLLRV